MTKEQLLKYKNICRHLEYLEDKIEEEKNREIDVVKGKVKGSSSEFPYIETYMSVEMYEPNQKERNTKKLLQLQSDKKKLLKEKKEIENFINNIVDIEIQMIFQYAFIDGLKQREIADKLHIDRSRISRKISNYLKTHTNHK